MEKIYMDHAATTYVEERVLDAMIPYFKSHFGNPSSVYETGREAKAVIETARETMAKLINAQQKNEIYFTSGGTESNNWAIKGAAAANTGKGKHIITTAVEHHAVLHPVEHLGKNGYDVTFMPVDRYGMVSPEQVEDAIRDDTILVSVMYANNEIGSINPIAEIGEVCHNKGVLFHTDAVQGAGVLPIDVKRMHVDLLSASAHKFYGPKGVGFLYVRNNAFLDNLLHGGGQERKRRAGTENVPYIVGMAEALRLAYENADRENRRIATLRDYMIREIKTKIPGTRLNGHLTMRLPCNINMIFENVEAQSSLISLDLAGIECSSGSACSAGSVEASHVLLSMGVPPEEAKCALRFTLVH
ncbi:MAG: cysteine desulfurase family protein, partial [Eubacteriales bacterium]